MLGIMALRFAVLVGLGMEGMLQCLAVRMVKHKPEDIKNERQIRHGGDQPSSAGFDRVWPELSEPIEFHDAPDMTIERAGHRAPMPTYSHRRCNTELLLPVV